MAARTRRVDRTVRPADRAGAVVAGAVIGSVPVTAVVATAAASSRPGLLRALLLVAPVLQAVFLVGVEVSTKRACILAARRQCRGAEQHQRDPSGGFSRTCCHASRSFLRMIAHRRPQTGAASALAGLVYGRCREKTQQGAGGQPVHAVADMLRAVKLLA